MRLGSLYKYHLLSIPETRHTENAYLMPAKIIADLSKTILHLAC